ncbi:GerMN domain-containing protein [Streptomyces sp. NPDC001604]|uniref:GerMN domain-containing protein n=1 Tax=Streptomyces sp. NPDC001604 TaxID=3364593 RepID=UPI0036A02081
MSTARRSAFLVWLPMLGALASCGIPTTGVVEAGGPASGVAPTLQVYFVAGRTLRGVDRMLAGPVDVESAVRVLLKGPTRAERAEGLYTVLPPEASLMSRVTVTSRDGRVTIRLSAVPGNSGDLAAAQLICTTVAAQRVIAPGADPQPVTVTGPGGLYARGNGTRCPSDSGTSDAPATSGGPGA